MDLARALGLLLLAIALPFGALWLAGRPRAALLNAGWWASSFGVMLFLAAGPGLAAALLTIPHAWWRILRGQRSA